MDIIKHVTFLQNTPINRFFNLLNIIYLQRFGRIRYVYIYISIVIYHRKYKNLIISTIIHSFLSQTVCTYNTITHISYSVIM